MSFLQNTCKPQGIAGKFMINMMNIGHSSLAKWGMGHLSFNKIESALDIGCGGGANVKFLLKHCYEGYVTGIDYSEVSVKNTTKKNKKAIEDGRCRVMQANVMDLPFKEKSFDIVTACETVYFWPDITKAFEGIYKVLKDNGSFMICNESNGRDKMGEKFSKIIEGMSLYTDNDLKQSLKKAGFSDILIDSKYKTWLCVVARK